MLFLILLLLVVMLAALLVEAEVEVAGAGLVAMPESANIVRERRHDY